MYEYYAAAHEIPARNGRPIAGFGEPLLPGLPDINLIEVQQNLRWVRSDVRPTAVVVIGTMTQPSITSSLSVPGGVAKIGTATPMFAMPSSTNWVEAAVQEEGWAVVVKAGASSADFVMTDSPEVLAIYAGAIPGLPSYVGAGSYAILNAPPALVQQAAAFLSQPLPSVPSLPLPGQPPVPPPSAAACTGSGGTWANGACSCPASSTWDITTGLCLPSGVVPTPLPPGPAPLPPAPAEPAATTPRWFLPAVIGVGGAVLLGVVLVARKKSYKSNRHRR